VLIVGATLHRGRGSGQRAERLDALEVDDDSATDVTLETHGLLVERGLGL